MKSEREEWLCHSLIKVHQNAFIKITIKMTQNKRINLLHMYIENKCVYEKCWRKFDNVGAGNTPNHPTNAHAQLTAHNAKQSQDDRREPKPSKNSKAVFYAEERQQRSTLVQLYINSITITATQDGRRSTARPSTNPPRFFT